MCVMVGEGLTDWQIIFLFVGVAIRTCGSDGNWRDPPNILQCQSTTFVDIEQQVAWKTLLITFSFHSTLQAVYIVSCRETHLMMLGNSYIMHVRDVLGLQSQRPRVLSARGWNDCKSDMS